MSFEAMSCQQTPKESQKIVDSINSLLNNINGDQDEVSTLQKYSAGSRKRVPRVINENTKAATKREKMIRTNRGKRIFELYQAHAVLATNAQSRRKCDNEERNDIWERITDQINKEFKNELQEITVASTKKLADYWKDRFRTSPSHSSSFSSPYQTAAIGRATVSPSPPNDLFDTPPYSPRIGNERVLEKERLAFLIKATKLFMRESGLDQLTHSRSGEVNERRNRMWILMEEWVNRKYGHVLKDLTNGQARKAFANYKKRHPKVFRNNAHMVNSRNQKDEELGETMELEEVEETEKELEVVNKLQSVDELRTQQTEELQQIMNYTSAVKTLKDAGLGAADLRRFLVPYQKSLPLSLSTRL